MTIKRISRLGTSQDYDTQLNDALNDGYHLLYIEQNFAVLHKPDDTQSRAELWDFAMKNPSKVTARQRDYLGLPNPLIEERGTVFKKEDIDNAFSENVDQWDL